MEQCSKTNEMQKKRQQLEKAIKVIDQQQRTSISQKKGKASNIELR
jgi:hypothetical protein